MPEPTDPAERWLYGAALAGLIGGAWVALWLLGASPYAPYFSHAFSADELWPGSVRIVLFVAGWMLMSVAMMLPSSLPLVTVFRTITKPARSPVVLLVAGYLAIWALFGLSVFFVDVGIVHPLVDASAWLARRPDVIPAAVLLAAGLFQFSPLKYSCLKQCRSPVGFVIQYWRGGSRALQAFGLGVRHGIFCVGCCWGLMLLMFGVGGINLGWMLALGAVMFVEKAAEWGWWITTPLGGLLGLWGFALLVQVPGVPLPF